MIRKAILILLTLAACVTGGLWVLSHVGLSRELRFTLFGIDLHHHSYEIPVWGAQGRFLNQLVRVEVWDGCTTIQVTKRSTHSPGFDWSYGELQVVRQNGLLASYGYLKTPLWLPFFLSATYPAISLVLGRLRRYRRRKRGWCIGCGYDLTGNLSGTCPECGERI